MVYGRFSEIHCPGKTFSGKTVFPEFDAESNFYPTCGDFVLVELYRDGLSVRRHLGRNSAVFVSRAFHFAAVYDRL